MQVGGAVGGKDSGVWQGQKTGEEQCSVCFFQKWGTQKKNTGGLKEARKGSLYGKKKVGGGGGGGGDKGGGDLGKRFTGEGGNKH